MQFSPPVGGLLLPPLLLRPCRLHVLFSPPVGSSLPLFAYLEVTRRGALMAHYAPGAACFLIPNELYWSCVRRLSERLCEVSLKALTHPPTPASVLSTPVTNIEVSATLLGSFSHLTCSSPTSW
jgi:hypothetical protein